MTSLLPLALLVPFAAGLALPLLRGRWAGARAAWLAQVVPVSAFGVILAAWLASPEGVPAAVRWAWVPSMGLDFSLRLDGLAALFALVVTGVGVLVFHYASRYFDAEDRGQGRFFGYLSLFQAAMLGAVLSDNVLMLFVFWEMTGLASFLLIGFSHDRPESRRGARMALVTTATTGLCLLVGVVLLGQAAGTYDLAGITEAVRVGLAPEREALLGPAFVFCFLGAMGKSAQVPFSFWLPNAMAAPTPVSAYLHSATMVKLGVFLTARLLPCFQGLEAWTPTLIIVGFLTMLLGAVLAVLSHDLKAVLAHSTVSQLGLLIGHYGLHEAGHAVAWDQVHLLNHVFYKASLFMVVGIIDHSAGTRDLRELGGLWRRMPVVAVAAAVALASMAGLPPTSGFLSKELLLKSAVDFWKTHDGALPWWPFVAVLAGSTLKVIFSVGIFHRAFLGKFPAELEKDWHAPGAGLQAAPVLLAAAALAAGVAAPVFGQVVAAFAVPGIHPAEAKELHLWHGWTPELMMSVGIVVAGFAAYVLFGWVGWHRAAVPRVLQWDRVFDALMDVVPAAGKRVNAALGITSPATFVPVLVATAVVAVGGLILVLPGVDFRPWEEGGLWPSRDAGWWRWVLGLGIVLGTVGVVVARSTIAQVFGLSVAGLGISAYFVAYAAPDLALTQFLVETALLLLVVVLVARFRRMGFDARSGCRPGVVRRLPRAALAGGAGVLAAALLFLAGEAGLPETARFYQEQSLSLAKGTNMVNTVVIDFRGFDTLLEIAVLVIATLGCLGLLGRPRRAGEPTVVELSVAEEGEYRPVEATFVLRAVAVALFFPLNMIALYLFLRGHNLPGGGFIAGLVTALSLLLVGLAHGLGRVRSLLRVSPLHVAAAGVLLAVVTAVVPVLGGGPLLHHFHAYADLPVLGKTYLGGPLFFDLGVYLAVVGVTLKILSSLLRATAGVPAFERRDAPLCAAALDTQIDRVRGSGDAAVVAGEEAR